MAKPDKFLTGTVGLNACNLASSGANAAPKMTRIEVYDGGPDSVILVPVSGYNLAEKPGRTRISREHYDAVNDRTTARVELARALMALCHYEA